MLQIAQVPLPAHLHTEHGCHHGSPDVLGCVLAGDDSRQGVVTTDADTQQEPPQHKQADEGGMGLPRRRMH
jgi:hypothetical protein